MPRGSQFPGTASVGTASPARSSRANPTGPKFVRSPAATNTCGRCSAMRSRIILAAVREAWMSDATRIRIPSPEGDPEGEVAVDEEVRNRVSRQGARVQERQTRLRVPFQHEPHQEAEADERPEH